MNTIRIPNNTQKVFIQDISKEPLDITYDIGADCDVTIIFPIFQSATISAHFALTKPHSDIHIIGIVSLAGSDKVLFHTDQHHIAGSSTSNLLVKGVLDGASTLLYDGAIRVDKNAQKTDAYQRNENLLLSSDTHAESKPGLEILANDVRCTHGATMSTVSEEQLWYLKTRGIDEKMAKQLIVNGFLTSALDRVEDTKMKDTVLARLPNFT